MQDIKIQFGLWHKKEEKLLKYSTSSNSGRDFCRETSTELELFGDRDWLVDSSVNAEFVRHYTTTWYNAGHDTPINNFDADELMVVRVKIEINIEEEKTLIPTPRELFIEKYSESNPGHLKNVLKALDEGREATYSYYDLMEHIEMRIKKNKETYDARSAKSKKD